MSKNIDNTMIAGILTRTCCRSFLNKAIANSDIEIVLKAGQASPSAKNRQPYFLIVIKNQNCKKEIAKAATIGRSKQFANWNQQSAQKMIKGNIKMNSNDRLITDSPVAILLLKNSDPEYKEGIPKNLGIKEEQGVACVAYSMMLAAQALNFGMAWICSVLNIPDELKKILIKYGIDWQDTWQPRAILPLGYPKNKKMKKPKRKDIKQISLWVK